MRLALGNRSLVATIIVIVMLTATLAVACPDSIHLPSLRSMDSWCLVMTHSSALGTAVGSDGAAPLVSMMLAIVLGLGAMLTLVRPTARRRSGQRGTQTLVRPTQRAPSALGSPSSLNGRTVDEA